MWDMEECIEEKRRLERGMVDMPSTRLSIEKVDEARNLLPARWLDSGSGLGPSRQRRGSYASKGN